MTVTSGIPAAISLHSVSTSGTATKKLGEPVVVLKHVSKCIPSFFHKDIELWNVYS
jgi:hypothetical protein